MVTCDETPRIDVVVTGMDSEKGGNKDMVETAVSDEKHSKFPEKERKVVLLEMLHRLYRKGGKLIVKI